MSASAQPKAYPGFTPDEIECRIPFWSVVRYHSMFLVFRGCGDYRSEPLFAAAISDTPFNWLIRYRHLCDISDARFSSSRNIVSLLAIFLPITFFGGVHGSPSRFGSTHDGLFSPQPSGCTEFGHQPPGSCSPRSLHHLADFRSVIQYATVHL